MTWVRSLMHRLERSPEWALGGVWAGIALAGALVVVLVLNEPPSPLDVGGVERLVALALWGLGVPGIAAGVAFTGFSLVGLWRADRGRERELDAPGRASGAERGLGAALVAALALSGAVSIGWMVLSADRIGAIQSSTLFGLAGALGVLGVAAAGGAAWLWRSGPAEPSVQGSRGAPLWTHLGMLSVLTAISVLLQLTLLNWFVEDAAISFAYARHLAEGHGLVTYPGGERVEGYSNPLWTFLIAGGYLLGIDGFISAKVLGTLAGAACVPLTWAIARFARPAVGDPVPLIAAALLAGSAQHAVWSASGLENSLFNVLLAAAMWRALAEGRHGGPPISALLWFGLAITRPEGILYAACGGALSMVLRALRVRSSAGGWRLWSAIAPTLGWLALFFVPFALYHAWRYSYFAWEFPNTYYAKKGNPSKSFEPWLWHRKGWKYLRGYAHNYAHGYLLPIYVIGALGLRGARGWLAFAAVMALGAVLLVPGPDVLTGLDGWGLAAPRWWVEIRVLVLVAVALAVLVGAVGRKGGQVAALCVSVCLVALFFAVYAGGDWMGAYRWMASLAVPQAVLFALGLGAIADQARHHLHLRQPWLGSALGVGGATLVGLALLGVGVGLLVPPLGEMPSLDLDLRPVDAATTLGAGAVLMVGVGAAAWRGGRGWGPTGWLVALLALITVTLPGVHHLDTFIYKPTTTPFTIRKRVSYMRDIERRLHLTERPVILDVDMGANMYWSGSEIVDIAGLVDVSMGHHWFEPAFIEEYIFRERVPDFAHLHGGWARSSRIDRRPGWKGNYVEIPSYRVRRNKTHGGNHVRRDLLVATSWPHERGFPVPFEGGLILEGLELPTGQAAPGRHLFVEIAWRRTKLDAPVEAAVDDGVPERRGTAQERAASGAPARVGSAGLGRKLKPLRSFRARPSADETGETDGADETDVLGEGDEGGAAPPSPDAPVTSDAVEDPTDFRVVLFLANDEGALHSWDLPPGYGWLPPSEWGPDEVVFGRHSVLIPEHLPLGDYRVGVVVLDEEGLVAPLGWSEPATSPASPAEARMAPTELRWSDAVRLVEPEAITAAVDADLDAVVELAEHGACSEAERRWVLAQRRVPRIGWRGLNPPRIAESLATCWARQAERAADPRDQVDLLARAHRRSPHSAAAQRVRAPRVAQWLAEAEAARLQQDWELAYERLSWVLKVDPSQSWARRRAEQARDCRLGIDRSDRCGDPPSRGRTIDPAFVPPAPFPAIEPLRGAPGGTGGTGPSDSAAGAGDANDGAETR